MEDTHMQDDYDEIQGEMPGLKKQISSICYSSVVPEIMKEPMIEKYDDIENPEFWHDVAEDPFLE